MAISASGSAPSQQPLPPPPQYALYPRSKRQEAPIPDDRSEATVDTILLEHSPDRPRTVPKQSKVPFDSRSVTGSHRSPSVRSSGASVMSEETTYTSPPPLQEVGYNEEVERLEPIVEDDPASYDLVAPFEEEQRAYSLEDRSELIMSTKHLRAIFDDPKLFLKFTRFLGANRPASLPVLIYYLDATKALKAIQYSNAVADALEPILGHGFSQTPVKPTVNHALEQKAQAAFDTMVKEDLPAYVAHVYANIVSSTIAKRITGTLPSNLRETSEGLAEVFCVTDPSRPDNPIVFASEEFYRTTQYGTSYAIGRNCRFLQGPRTNKESVRRIRETLAAGKDHTEVFLNYRRDGSPFMNLLMTATLRDSRGKVRYHIGAQVDVSGLAKAATGLDAILELDRKQQLDEQRALNASVEPIREEDEERDCFQELSEMLNFEEIDVVRKHGGKMHRDEKEAEETTQDANWAKPRLVLKDASGDVTRSHRLQTSLNGRLGGVYQNYFLVRPYPSLRILFASPTLRTPGILQSPFLDKLGGSQRVRDEIGSAMADGRGITAKVRWIVKKGGSEGRNRWIHCTPLLNGSAQIGVWMVVVVDDEGEAEAVVRPRQAPAVMPVVSLDMQRQAFPGTASSSVASSPKIWASQEGHPNRPESPSSLII